MQYIKDTITWHSWETCWNACRRRARWAKESKTQTSLHGLLDSFNMNSEDIGFKLELALDNVRLLSLIIDKMILHIIIHGSSSLRDPRQPCKERPFQPLKKYLQRLFSIARPVQVVAVRGVSFNFKTHFSVTVRGAWCTRSGAMLSQYHSCFTGSGMAV